MRISDWSSDVCSSDLSFAFPDRIARRDDGNPLRYTLANGRGARLHEDTALLGEPWLVVLDLRLEARDSLVFAAAPLDPRLLAREFPLQFTRERVLRWNDERAAAEAFDEQRFGAIVLARRSRSEGRRGGKEGGRKCK